MYQTLSITQKNGTPLKNPKNNGGSPIGVKCPANITYNKNEKYNMIRLNLSWFILMNGLIKSIEAPVVPIIFEITAPNNKK